MKSGYVLTAGLMFLQAFTASSALADVTSSDSKDSRVVRVTRVDSEHRRFELCSDPSFRDCRVLGSRDFSIKELRLLADRELVKAGAKAAGDVGIVAATVAAFGGIGFFAGFGGSVVTFSNGIGAMHYGLTAAGVTAALGVPAGIYAASKALNPAENFKNARTLRGDILNDKDVRVSNLSDYVPRLEAGLEHLSSEAPAGATASSAR